MRIGWINTDQLVPVTKKLLSVRISNFLEVFLESSNYHTHKFSENSEHFYEIYFFHE